jgi:hypothetical protein
MPTTYEGTDERPTTNGVKVMGAVAGSTMQASATDKLDLSALPLPCNKFHNISVPLVGVRPVIEAGNTVCFDSKKAAIRNAITGQTILEAHYDPTRRLYMMPLHDKDLDANHHRALRLSPQHPTNIRGLATAIKHHTALKLTAYETDTIPDLIKYLHAAAGYPSKRTWIRGIKNNFYAGWPGLTAKRVLRHLGPNEHTTNGHMKLISQGVNSTTRPPRKRNTPRTRHHALTITVIPTEDVTTDVDLSGLIGTDLPGRYPITSARGHKYIFVLYDADANYIHAEPIKSRSADDLVNGFTQCYQALTKNNFKARVIRLDNETSAQFKDHIENTENLIYQLVPPRDHRTNPCERAIQTFKNHFIAMLSGADPNFPTNCWDLLLPQANITLNLLRQSAMQPKLSAYAQIHGQFDFNRTPLAPAGCLVKVYENTDTRRSWAYHAKDAYYTRPAMNHYRCYTCYDTVTKHEAVSNTVQFFPKQCPMPATTSTDRLHMILQDLTDTLQQPHPATPFLQQGTATNAGVRKLLEILTAWTDIGPRVPTPTKPTGSHDKAAHPTSPRKTKLPTSAPRVTDHTVIKCNPIPIAAPRVEKKPHQDPRIVRTTRSNSIYAIGTIVRKRFDDYKYYEGEVTKYDYVNAIYTIKFKQGDTEEYTHNEVKRHYKQNQVYSGTKYGKALTARYDTNFNFNLFPTPKQARKVPHRALAAGGTVWDEELNKMAHYRELIIHPNPEIQKRWMQAACNEFGRLFQGYQGTEGMDVLEWIPKNRVPKHKMATYARYTVAVRPEKDEKYRCRITGGGDRLTYNGEVSTHTSSLETFKLLLNSTISTKGAKMATGDISNMYLYSFLDECEYVRFKVDQIPPEIITHYQQEDNIVNGFLYAKVKKAWYGLKQSGKIAHDDLVQHLEKYGYKKLPFTEGLFKHETRDIAFSLVVDDFAIKYVKKEDADHLIECMGAKYPFKVDWEAKQYIGIHLDWTYDSGNRSVVLSMPGYVQDALEELQHTAPKQHTYGPSHMEEPAYGQKIQYAKVEDNAILGATLIKFIQRTTGKFLYYARAIDNTMLHALNNIASSKTTAETMKATKYFLNYAACNPNAQIIYRQSEMVLQGDSDAAYLVCPQARSRAGGYIYVGNKDKTLFNGPILVLARVIKNVMASAAEAEVAALYMNAQEIVPMRQCLIELGHPQPPTPLKTDNSTATGILTGTIKQKRSKAIDMRFYWLKDRVKQKQFDVYWEPGLHNLADYTTKHHSGNHHRRLRPIQLYEKDSPKTVQGCIKLLNYKTKKPRVRPAHKALTVTWADQHNKDADAREQNQVKYHVRHTQKCDQSMLINNQGKNHLKGKPSTSQRIRPQKILTQPLKLNSRTDRAYTRGAIQRLFHSTHIF